MGKKIDLTGQRFGRLVVLCEDHSHGKLMWRCRCDCGNEVLALSGNLRKEYGGTKSCGCRHKEIKDDVWRLKLSHGLLTTNPKLYNSVRSHFKYIRTNYSGYKEWTLDERYTDDTNGIVKFCRDLIALQPDACARYEVDRTLDLDKDNNAENIFRPESIVFIPSSENRGKLSSCIRLSDGTRFNSFCKEVGVVCTARGGGATAQYQKYVRWFKIYGTAHPELLKKANELIALYRKTLEMLRLRDEIRRLRASF